MTPFVALALAAGLLGAPLPSPAHADTSLVAMARTHPDDLRDSLRQTMRRAAIDTSPDAEFAAARELAGAWATAWADSFPLRQVAQLASWSPADRRAKALADSLRRAGNAALGKDGFAAALREWRKSTAKSGVIGDSAGIAATLGNIGAGYYESGELDSAEAYLRRSRDRAERIGDLRTEGNAVGTLATLLADRGESRRAVELYSRAAEIRAHNGDDRGAAADRNNLGLVAQSLGDLAQARRAFTDALASNRGAARDEPAAVNLTNLGNLASLEGDYTSAIAHYGDALALYLKHDDRVDAAGVTRDLGLLDLQRGDYRKALDHFVAALAVYRATGPAGDEIDVRREIAVTHAAMGNLQGALIQYRAAERLASAGDPAPQTLADLALARADLAVDFNTYAEAERQYERAGQLYRMANDARGQAQAASGLAMLDSYRKDAAASAVQASVALRTAEASADRQVIATSRLLVGAIQAEGTDTAAARASLTKALAEFRALENSVGEAASLGVLGDLAARERLPLAAESLYRRALARIAGVPAPSVSWQLRAGLADALRSRRALDDAAREYRAAIRDVESMSTTLPVEERRAAFLADKWDVYAELAHVEMLRGRTADAFDASERLRARELLDLLARGRVNTARSGSGSDAVASREQDLRRQIDVLTGQLEDSRFGDMRGPLATGRSSGAVREALALAQQRYGELLLEMRESRPEYAALVSGEIAPVKIVMASLAPDQALLEYLVGDSSSYVFIVTSDTVAAVDLNVSRHELASLVDFSRGVLARPSAGSSNDLWRAPLRRLDRYLIEPAEASGLLAGKRELIVAPQAELHYVPFAALLGAKDYLVERYRVVSVPSASVWLRLRGRPVSRETGVLAMAPRVDALPGSIAEVAAIGNTFGPRATVLVGPAASKEALQRVASQQAIIHFATYGVLNKDNPLFSFVELAPQHGSDGRLEVHEVFGLQLNARLVVLSACQTALGAGAQEDVPSGDDWVGLVQAFHTAGAANVMAALWPVDDRATADLMGDFYAALAAGHSESESLALAQRKMLRNKGTAHPFYWAAFTMSGGN